MPITANLLTTGKSTDLSSLHQTGSYTPTSGSLVLAVVGTRTTNSSAPPTLERANTTWVNVTSTSFGTTDSTKGPWQNELSVFRAMSNTVGAADTTIRHSSGSRIVSWHIVEFAGVSTASTDGAGAVVQVATTQGVSGTTASPITANLGPFGSSLNASFGAFVTTGGATTFATGTGYAAVARTSATVITTQGASTFLAAIQWNLFTEFQASTQTSVAAVPDDAGERVIAIGLELAHSTVVPDETRPKRMMTGQGR